MRLCGLTMYLGQGQAQQVCESMHANAAPSYPPNKTPSLPNAISRLPAGAAT
jgi:hypothetical protein